MPMHDTQALAGGAPISGSSSAHAAQGATGSHRSRSLFSRLLVLFMWWTTGFAAVSLSACGGGSGGGSGIPNVVATGAGTGSGSDGGGNPPSVGATGGGVTSGGNNPNVVATDKGSVSGAETADLRKFLGIPFAAPPVSALRWQAPQPAAAWSTTRQATSFATHCPQSASVFGQATNTSEDCLYLNVFRPKDGGPYPVMVYIHGGANYLGESDDYDPTDLVKQGVVVVTVNYRLGALGFLAHPDLSTEGGGSSGNYGVMDQQAALQWVQGNIAAFGGDKNNVTIFGESAGGHNVHAHLTSPLSKGLFHKAISESGAYADENPSLASAETKGAAFATAAGCTTQVLACLRGLSVDQVLANQGALIGGNGVTAIVDNKVLKQSHRSAFASGNFNKVPVIEGSNLNESSLFTALFFDTTAPVTAANYATAEAMYAASYGYPQSTSQIGAVYPLASFAGPVPLVDAVGTALAFSCPARAAARAMSGYTVAYQYEFADPNPPMIYLPDTASHTAGSWGAYHASELQYLFKVAPSLPSPTPMTTAQQALSAQMVAFWAQFAKTGNPNASGSSSWPIYAIGTDTAISLRPDGNTATTDFAARHQCAFWLPTL